MSEKKNNKWLHILSLGMGLPSTILGLSWISMQLVKEGVLNRIQGVLVLVSVVSGMLFLMVYYAYKRKD